MNICANSSISFHMLCAKIWFYATLNTVINTNNRSQKPKKLFWNLLIGLFAALLIVILITSTGGQRGGAHHIARCARPAIEYNVESHIGCDVFTLYKLTLTHTHTHSHRGLAVTYSHIYLDLCRTYARKRTRPNEATSFNIYRAQITERF